MPDTDPMGFLCTLQAEQSMQADALRREAQRHREEATACDNRAGWHEERATWLGSAIAAMNALSEEEA